MHVRFRPGCEIIILPRFFRRKYRRRRLPDRRYRTLTSFQLRLRQHVLAQVFRERQGRGGHIQHDSSGGIFLRSKHYRSNIIGSKYGIDRVDSAYST